MAGSLDTMSSEQLREQLYQEFKAKGVLENMKSQLRQRLATELHKSTPLESSTSQDREKGSVLDALVSSGLVGEHLSKAGFHYSLSVFLPEARLTSDQLCSMSDLVHYLRLPETSPLYDKLLPSQPDQSILEQLLKALANCSWEPPPQPVQKSPAKPQKKSVAEQLRDLDHCYALKAEEQELHTQHRLDERLLSFQREVEAQHKVQLETELSLYKTRELAKVRAEERECYQSQLLSERLEMSTAHQKKIEDLRKAEQNMIEQYRKKEQELEAGIHSQRQALLAEMSTLKLRESELQRQTEMSKRTVSLEEERLAKLSQQLNDREKALESHHQSLSEDNTNKVKLELESQLATKHSELSLWEARLQTDQSKSQSLQTSLTKLSTQLQNQRDKTDQLQTLYHEAMSRQITLQGQKDSLQKRVEDADNTLKIATQQLQQELATAERKLVEYKRRNSENQRLIRTLQSSRPPAQEIDSLTRELSEIRTTHHKEVSRLEGDNRELRRRLGAQTELCVGLQKRVDDQMIELLSAQHDMKDIHLALEQMRVSKGNSSKPAAEAHRPRVTSTPSTERTQPIAPVCSHAQLASGLSSPAQPDSPDQLLAETKATIAQLEIETQQIEHTCQHLHPTYHRQQLPEVVPDRLSHHHRPVKLSNVASNDPLTQSPQLMSTSSSSRPTIHSHTHQQQTKSPTPPQPEQPMNIEGSPDRAPTPDAPTRVSLDTLWKQQPAPTEAEDDKVPSHDPNEGEAPVVEAASKSEDGVDPVMLKYMDIVQQGRLQKPQVESPTVVAADNEVLSLASESFAKFSDKDDDDPFDDW